MNYSHQYDVLRNHVISQSLKLEMKKNDKKSVLQSFIDSNLRHSRM